MGYSTGVEEEVNDTLEQTVKVELTIDQWTLRYGYAVAKSHRHDSAWMLGSMLGVDIKDARGDPCIKEAFKDLLIKKYDTSDGTVIKDAS